MAQDILSMGIGVPSGQAKTKAVTELVDRLANDLEQLNLQAQERDSDLEQLKVFGRDPRDAEPIFTKRGIQTICRHAFEAKSPTTSRNALRCLANAMLLKPETRQMFVDFDYQVESVEKIKNDNRDDEFLLARILLLATYGTSLDLLQLTDGYGLASALVLNLERHEDRLSAHSPKAKADPMEDMALAETTKLLFNLTKMQPETCPLFESAISPLVHLICEKEVSASKPLDPPLGTLINPLMNLNLKAEGIRPSLYPAGKPLVFVTRLVELLDLASKAYSDTDVEATVTPVVATLGSMAEDAPEAVRGFLKDKLLPNEADRHDVLGRSPSLPSRLLRCTTNPIAPNLGDAVSHLLFSLSDNDAAHFVENIGYGFASGFLFKNNIPIPDAAEGEGSSRSVSLERPTNPVTGQFLDTEGAPELPEMTDAEKEREAEKLFVLFERLKQNGIINVENPLATAVREGRFEELGDDRVEELD